MLELKLQRKAGSTRCPFCHDACEAHEDVAICTHCLSRHHQACWQEAACCSACRADEAARCSTCRADEASKPHPDPWHLPLPELLFAEVCLALASCTLLVMARPLTFAYENMGVTLPWATKALLSNPPLFVLLVLSLIPIGAVLERKANLRGAGWTARTLAVLAIFSAPYFVYLPISSMEGCLQQ